MPTGIVIVDEYTSLGFEAPITLKDWIKDEIEWVGDPRAGQSTLGRHSEKAFDYSGPLPCHLVHDGWPP